MQANLYSPTHSPDFILLANELWQDNGEICREGDQCGPQEISVSIYWSGGIGQYQRWRESGRDLAKWLLTCSSMKTTVDTMKWFGIWILNFDDYHFFGHICMDCHLLNFFYETVQPQYFLK